MSLLQEAGGLWNYFFILHFKNIKFFVYLLIFKSEDAYSQHFSPHSLSYRVKDSGFYLISGNDITAGREAALPSYSAIHYVIENLLKVGSMLVTTLYTQILPVKAPFFN